MIITSTRKRWLKMAAVELLLSAGEWKQSIKLLCVSSAGATVSTQVNSFTYTDIHMYILWITPLSGRRNKAVAVLGAGRFTSGSVVDIDWCPADRGASLLSSVLVASHSGYDKCREKKTQNVLQLNGNLLHDWCHWHKGSSRSRVEGPCCWLALNVFLK